MTGLCLLCSCPEPDSIMSNGKKRVYKPSGQFVCSKCTRILVDSTPEQIKRAYEKAIELGMKGKELFLENLLEEEEYGSEIIRPYMGGKRTRNETRFTRQKRGQKPTTI